MSNQHTLGTLTSWILLIFGTGVELRCNIKNPIFFKISTNGYPVNLVPKMSKIHDVRVPRVWCFDKEWPASKNTHSTTYMYICIQLLGNNQVHSTDSFNLNSNLVFLVWPIRGILIIKTFSFFDLETRETLYRLVQFVLFFFFCASDENIHVCSQQSQEKSAKI